MGITRANKSLLLDRHVRVYRQLKIDDAMGGTYLEFSTIIERYWCRLWPEQHQLRERVHLGDQKANFDFRAVGHPSHNGMTIMPGDRFHDVKNNRCYDVVAVKRPRPGLAYSAMHHFELRILEDGCPRQPPVTYETSAGGGAGAGSGQLQTHFIMRNQVTGNQIFGWETLPYFDGMIYNLQYDDPAQIAQLAAMVAAGKRWWRYYAVFDYPFSGTAFGGTTPPLASWFNFLRDNVQFTGLGGTSHRRYRVADTVSLFNAYTGPDGQKREIIPWSLITVIERTAIIGQMVNKADLPGGVSIPCAGVFFDQCWLDVPEFFVEDGLTEESGHGNVKEGSPKLTALDYAGSNLAFGEGGTWASYRAAVLSLFSEINTALGGTRYAIFNGEHDTVAGSNVPKPWHLENAWDNIQDGGPDPGGVPWTNAKAHFATDPRNVLHIQCYGHLPNSAIGVPEALAFWQEVGGWISFTSDDTPGGDVNRELAYTEAAAILAGMGFPNG